MNVLLNNTINSCATTTYSADSVKLQTVWLSKKLESKRVVDVITCPVSRQHKWHSLNSQQSITRRQTILSKEAYPFIRVRIAVSSSTW